MIEKEKLTVLRLWRNAPQLKEIGFIPLLVCILSACSTATPIREKAIITGGPLTADNPLTRTANEMIHPSPTSSKTQTPIPAGGQELSPSHSPTTIPTVTPFPGMRSGGPYFVFHDSPYVPESSATFIDLTGSTHWTIFLPQTQPLTQPVPTPPHRGLSHDWKWYAYVAGTVETSGAYPEGGVVLRLLNLLTGLEQEVADLVPEDYYIRQERMVKQHIPACESKDCTGLIKTAITVIEEGLHAFTWSPDGRYLAFTAIREGDSSSLYVFDIDTGKIRRMEDGPGDIRAIYWSPDGQWILFQENIMTEAPWLAPGSFWAVRIDGTELKQLPGPKKFVSWFSDYEYLAVSFLEGQGVFAGPCAVNILTGDDYCPFGGTVFDYENDITVDIRSRLMGVFGVKSCYDDTDCEKGFGLYIGPVYGQLKRISDQRLGTRIIPRGGTVYPFLVGGDGSYFGISTGGAIHSMDYSGVNLSDNYWLASVTQTGISVYDPVDKLRYELKVMPPDFLLAKWDTNAQGMFLLTRGAVYYWPLGDPESRMLFSCVDVCNPAQMSFAAIVNISTLPNLRILPTRAVKSAEGISIWSQTTYKELFQPGTNHYDVTIPAYSSWRWSFSLGTTDPSLFEKILPSEDIEFRINGEWIDSNMFRMSDKTEEGRFSRVWAAMLYGWHSGDRAELEIHYTLHSAVRDGNVEYPAGEYRQVISLVVE
jgi:hypothetical protein